MFLFPRRMVLLVLMLIVTFPVRAASRRKTPALTPPVYKIAQPRQAVPVKEPELIVNYDPGIIKYRYQKDVDCGGKSKAGCTHSQSYYFVRYSQTPQGDAKIVLNIGFRPFFIELTTKNSFGSCYFDVLLKHELTHVALYRSVMESYIKVIGAGLKQRAIQEQKQGKTAVQVGEAIKASARDSYENYKKDVKAQNDLLDKDGQSAYQYGQCRDKQ